MNLSPAPRPRIRRDVNLTAVLVTIVLVGGVLALAWIGVAGVLAMQGLDTRGMLSVRLGPQEWATAGGFIAGLGAFLAMLKRMGKNERAVRKDLPEHVDAATAAVAEQIARQIEEAVDAAVTPLVDLIGDLVDALDDSHARSRRQGVAEGMERVLEQVRARRTGQLPAQPAGVVPAPRADPPWEDVVRARPGR